jgi:hypothetical protein
MPRIKGIDPDDASEITRARIERETKRFGHVLSGTLITGLTPTIQRGAAALDEGIGAAGGIPPVLRTMLNLRVASIVGCPF